MQAIEIIVIVLAVAVVLGVAILQIIRKKQGKTSCDCGECGGNCANCRAKQIELAKQKNAEANSQKERTNK